VNKAFTKGDIVRFNNKTYPNWFNKTFQIIDCEDNTCITRCLNFVSSGYPIDSIARISISNVELVPQRKKPTPQLELF